jgi:hypothetical protein
MTIMNKKVLLLFLLAVLNILAIKAQVGEQRYNMAVGFNGGICDNSVSFTPRIKQNGLYGITGGLTARYISEKYFKMICGAQLELNYAQLGWKEKIDDGSKDSYSRTMNYVQIPFLAHLAFGKEPKGLQIFFNIGPQVGFLLNEKESFSKDFSYTTRTVVKQYHKKADKKFDYGITGGMGFELKTKAGNFLVEGRYYYGLADFYNTTKKDYFSRAANTTIYAKLTYLFDISH